MVLHRPIGRRLERERRYLAADQNVGSVRICPATSNSGALDAVFSLIWDLLSQLQLFAFEVPLWWGDRSMKGESDTFFRLLLFFLDYEPLRAI